MVAHPALAQAEPAQSPATETPVTQSIPAEIDYSPELVQPNIPIEFTADDLSYDKENNVISASGHVILSNKGRKVEADSIKYLIDENKLEASGNVLLTEATGDKFSADYVVLRNDLKDGFIQKLKVELMDDSRFWAEQSQKTGDKVVFKDARYTPCKPCIEDAETTAQADEKTPPWQIKANKITWDKEEKTVTYKGATFEAGGVPVFYTPYFKHPDGTVDQKTGLLRPSFGYKSQLGAFYDQDFYYAIDETQDASIGVIAASRESPVLKGEYRKNFGYGTYSVNGSVTDSGRVDDINGAPLKRDGELRGHLFADGLMDINENWRAGADVNLTSDQQYLRQFGFDEQIVDDDILTSQVFAERFEDRDYTRARIMSFQDNRVRQFRNDDQPVLFPDIITEFYGKPNDVLGGRWGFKGSVLNLTRDGNGQDVTRLIAQGDWERRFIADNGLVTTANASIRGDSFFTRDIDPATLAPGQNRSDTTTRAYPRLHLMSQYPLAKDFKGGKWLIEPIGALTISPNITEDKGVPNEDSADTQLDITNLYDPNRFTGRDRIEDRSHVTYGARTGFYKDNGDFGDVFLGQSYRLEEDGNPFTAGSGLSDQYSDFVGAIRAQLADDYTLNYRLQLDGRDLNARRHEANAQYNGDVFGLTAYYFFVDSIATTGFNTSREQLTGAGYLNLNDQWRLNNHTIYDLGVGKTGLLKTTFGVDYLQECYTLSLAAERNFTDRSSGESSTSITFRVGLKNLSELGAK